MIKIVYPLCFVLAIMNASCQSNSNSNKTIKTDWEKLGLKGKVKSLNISTIPFDKNNPETITDNYSLDFNKYGFIAKIKLPASPSPMMFGEDGEMFSHDTINGEEMREL